MAKLPLFSGNQVAWLITMSFFYFSKDLVYLLLERGGGREIERERNINVWLPLKCPQLETWPKTPECALTGNQTHDLLVWRATPNPLSHTSHSYYEVLEVKGRKPSLC